HTRTHTHTQTHTHKHTPTMSEACDYSNLSFHRTHTPTQTLSDTTTRAHTHHPHAQPRTLTHTRAQTHLLAYCPIGTEESGLHAQTEPGQVVLTVMEVPVCLCLTCSSKNIKGSEMYLLPFTASVRNIVCVCVCVCGVSLH